MSLDYSKFSFRMAGEWRPNCGYMFASMVLMAEKSALIFAGFFFDCEQSKSICSAKWNIRLQKIVSIVSFGARAFECALPVNHHLIIVSSRCHYCLLTGMAHTICPYLNHVVGAWTCCKADCLVEAVNDICCVHFFVRLNLRIGSWHFELRCMYDQRSGEYLFCSHICTANIC